MVHCLVVVPRCQGVVSRSLVRLDRRTRRHVLCDEPGDVGAVSALHAKPASVNRSLPVLSVILRQAEVYGYRPEDSNPCKDIKRYHRRVRERFLSPDEHVDLDGAEMRIVDGKTSSRTVHLSPSAFAVLAPCPARPATRGSFRARSRPPT